MFCCVGGSHVSSYAPVSVIIIDPLYVFTGYCDQRVHVRKSYHHGNWLPWEVRVLNGDVRNDTTRTALNGGLLASAPYDNSKTYAIAYNSAGGGGVQHTDPHISFGPTDASAQDTPNSADNFRPRVNTPLSSIRHQSRSVV